jgi:hypothetical protein
MEHTTTGLPIDNRQAAERAYDIVTEHGYVREDHLLRAALPEGDGYDRKGICLDLQAGPVANGTLVMVWTAYGHPYYLTPVHALRIAGRLTWVEDKGETVPVVRDASQFVI